MTFGRREVDLLLWKLLGNNRHEKLAYWYRQLEAKEDKCARKPDDK